MRHRRGSEEVREVVYNLGDFRLAWKAEGFPAGTLVKTPAANAGDARDTGSVSGSGTCLEKGNGYPLSYSSRENSMDRGAWWATVHGSQGV